MFNRNNTALIALFIFTVISFQTLSHAQLNSVTAGSTSDLGNNCYQTPPDLQIQSGGVWYDNPIYLDEDFTIYYQNSFGIKDRNGADGIDHNIKIVWIANIETLEVYFDCELRISVTKDMKTDIFDGDGSVFFGFVGSTEGLSNLHQVCFNSISFVENLNLVDTTIYLGESAPLDATIPSRNIYSWNQTMGVNNANPTLAPTVTTTFTVSSTDICGDVTTEYVLITVNPAITPTFTTINPICEGDILLNLPTISNNGFRGT